MKGFLFFLLVLTIHIVASGQTAFFSKDGKISFYSKAPMENIEAHNSKAVSVFDAASGQVEFSVLMKGFEFEKAKMQEHFNENYVESDKFPKATFVGKIQNIQTLKITQDGNYALKVAGTLTIHGVSKDQTAQAVFTVKDGNISAVSEFTISLADYNIQIPSLVAEKVSKTVKIAISIPSYKPRS